MRIATASVRTGFAMTGYKECGKAGRCRHRPLRRVTRGAAKRAVGDAGPYGRIIGGVVGRADVGIGPYESVTRNAVQGSAGDRKGRPYGGLQVVQGAGRCGHRPLRRVTRGAAKRAVGGCGLPQPVCALASQ